MFDLDKIVSNISRFQKIELKKRKKKSMKYVIARAINGISINGNEYLLDDNNKVLEFNTREECVKHCESVGLDDSYVWEEKAND